MSRLLSRDMSRDMSTDHERDCHVISAVTSDVCLGSQTHTQVLTFLDKTQVLFLVKFKNAAAKKLTLLRVRVFKQQKGLIK